MDPLTLAAIAAATTAIGTGTQAAVTSGQNRASREWSERMYHQQRQDNIADNLTQWERVNAYNSPQQQMQRFSEAGLNPHLIYGQGNSGNAPALTVPKTDVQRPEFKVPDIQSGIAQTGSILANYMDYEIKAAQVDNLRADNTVKIEDAALKAAQRDNVTQGTQRSVFDLALASELREVSADARREQLRKLKADTDFQLNENERREAMNASTLREAAERILSMRVSRTNNILERKRIQAQVNNLDQDTRIKRLDAELKSQGINPTDPIWMRMLGRILEGAIDATRDYWNPFKN